MHTTAVEFETANHPPTGAERRRYRGVQWGHAPTVRTYCGGGERWRGFDVAYPVAGVDGVSIVAMVGHTRGHALVGVDGRRSRLVVACRRCRVRSGSIAITADSAEDQAKRRAVRVYEQVIGQDRSKITGNHARLTEVRAAGSATVIPAHDPVIFDRMLAAHT